MRKARSSGKLLWASTASSPAVEYSFMNKLITLVKWRWYSILEKWMLWTKCPFKAAASKLHKSLTWNQLKQQQQQQQQTKSNPLKQSYMLSFYQGCTFVTMHRRARAVYMLTYGENSGYSWAHDAANFTWQGVTTAAQRCSTLPSVDLQPVPRSNKAGSSHHTPAGKCTLFVQILSSFHIPTHGRSLLGRVLNKKRISVGV